MKKFNIGCYVKVLFRGLVRTIWGALSAGLFYAAVRGFSAIPSEGGYTAVCEFVVAVCFVIIALCSIYVLGLGSFQKPKKCAGGR